jgi:hypothetical protein
LLVIAVVLIAVPWTFKLTGQGQLGESCEGGFDCAVVTGRCVMGEQGRFCTEVCTGDDACPSNAHCGIPPHDFFQVWFSTSPMSEHVCVPGPRPERPPSLGDFEPPGSDHAAPQLGSDHAAPQLGSDPAQPPDRSSATKSR